MIIFYWKIALIMAQFLKIYYFGYVKYTHFNILMEENKNEND